MFPSVSLLVGAEALVKHGEKNTGFGVRQTRFIHLLVLYLWKVVFPLGTSVFLFG